MTDTEPTIEPRSCDGCGGVDTDPRVHIDALDDDGGLSMHYDCVPVFLRKRLPDHPAYKFTHAGLRGEQLIQAIQTALTEA